MVLWPVLSPLNIFSMASARAGTRNIFLLLYDGVVYSLITMGLCVGVISKLNYAIFKA